MVDNTNMCHILSLELSRTRFHSRNEYTATKIPNMRKSKYRKISNISRTKSKNLNVSRLAVVFAQSNEARCEVENEHLSGAAPTGDAPTTYRQFYCPPRCVLYKRLDGTHFRKWPPCFASRVHVRIFCITVECPFHPRLIVHRFPC